MRLLSVDARITGRDRGALAQLIESAEADVACVHHGPHLLRWRSISAALGRRSGLVVVGGGRPAAANLVLSTLGVDALGTTDVLLTEGRHGPAGASIAHLRHEGTDVTLVSATLVGNAARRLEQAHRLRRAIEDSSVAPSPVVLSILGADRPGTGAWQTLVDGRVPVAGRVFVDERLRVGACTELPDHAGAAVPPVVVEIATS